ncbi:aminotransferase-like domain-containing protein [Enemella dayhoffiae]|uniref:aminotransferase-like domain-containing protein n=1 Tax=Enemella dayhoffiae TaxID=2016507 RepID=UPI001E34705C|nr:PLP-dependent aminotransferase family protein [Enemella dayhoffiae]
MTDPRGTTTIGSLDPLPTQGIRGGFAENGLPLARLADGLVGSVIDSSTSLLAGIEHDVVRFAMGAPAPEAIPVQALRELAGGALDAGSFTYGASEGEPGLLAAIADGYADTRGTSAERVVITSGGMQGLDLACKLFIDPGDLVVVESPTYTNGSATALSYGAELLEIPIDDSGMVIDELVEQVAASGRTPKLIYTICNFQNPSGVTLSAERRQRLLELAHRWGAVILDDDPYGLLRFVGDDLPGFAELSPGDPHVFSVRTFSKVLAPGLRVGWVDADHRLRPLLISAKQAMDTCTNVPNQHLIDGFLRGGGLQEHLTGLRDTYRLRRDALLRSLAAHLGDRVRSTVPEGGMFCWVTLLGDGAVSAHELFEVALGRGVAFIPGPALSPSGRFGDALRICYATEDPGRIDVGVRRLAAALDELEAR